MSFMPDLVLQVIQLQQQKINELEQQVKNLSSISKEINQLIDISSQKAQMLESFIKSPILDELNVNAYCIGSNNALLYLNNQAKQYIDLPEENYIGKNMLEVCEILNWSKEATEQVCNNNNAVRLANQILTFEETHAPNSKEEVTFTSQKSPWVVDGIFKGVIGIAFDITQQKQKQKELSVINNDFTIISKLQDQTVIDDTINCLKKQLITLNIQGEKVNLTKKQTLCLFLLISHGSSKKIANKLFLSHRTVEEHLAIMRNKLGCRNRTELIMTAISGGFLNSISEIIENVSH